MKSLEQFDRVLPFLFSEEHVHTKHVKQDKLVLFEYKTPALLSYSLGHFCSLTGNASNHVLGVDKPEQEKHFRFRTDRAVV